MTIVPALLVIIILLLLCDGKITKAITAKVSKLMSPASPEQEIKQEISDEISDAVADGTASANDAVVETFLNNRSHLPTWEPSTFDFDKVDNDALYSAYAEELKGSVDRAIVESHKEYVADSDYMATTGASHATDRDDFTPPVKFHGLPRKAHYTQLGAENTSRVSQSETPEEVQMITDHNSTGYAL